MSLPVALGVYFICWWLVLFTVLPIGVRAPGEDDEKLPGHADSAPMQPYLLRKFLATTVISALVFAIVYAVITYRLIPFDWIPGPR
jgi:predicted secreted protein